MLACMASALPKSRTASSKTMLLMVMRRSYLSDHADLVGCHLLGPPGSAGSARLYWHTRAPLSRSRLEVMASV